MDLQKLRELVSESPSAEWLLNLQATFNFAYSDCVKHFVGITAIYEYVNIQVHKWDSVRTEIPNKLLSSLTYFIDVKNSVIDFISTSVAADEEDMKSKWRNVEHQILSVYSLPLDFDSPVTQYLVEIYKEFPEYFEGAYNTLLSTNNYNLGQKENLYGAILSYEFLVKKSRKLNYESKSDIELLGKDRALFDRYLSNTETSILDLIEKLKNNEKDLKEEFDLTIEHSNNEFKKWFQEIKVTVWENWYKEKIELMERLEKTYESKLKLEKPAKYWTVKSNQYLQQAQIAKKLLFCVVGVTSLLLIVLLFTAPEWIFFKVFEGNSVAVIRWSILLLIFISLVAYAIRAITKYMFSSFHLARDAEERHALTFFYLALSRETEMNSDERKLILQSLFSRSDTGLLKDDSAPTMSNDSINRVIKSNPS